MITPKERKRTNMGLSRYWDWDPFKELSRIHRMMEELMNEVFGSDYTYSHWNPTPNEMKETTWVPPVNMYLKDNSTLCMEVYLPGMNKENMELSVTPNSITISGTNNSPEIPNENWMMWEFPYGKFHRTIELPYEIKPNEVKANYENGILKVIMPLKTPEKEHVKVTIS